MGIGYRGAPRRTGLPSGRLPSADIGRPFPSLQLPVARHRRSRSTVHLDISVLTLAYGPDPEDVVAADEDLAQGAREVVLDVLLRVGQLNVHVAVDGNPAMRTVSFSVSSTSPRRTRVCTCARTSQQTVYMCDKDGGISQSALVLGLPPLETHPNLLVYPVTQLSVSSARDNMVACRRGPARVGPWAKTRTGPGERVGGSLA